ncbi:MAG: AAA family ATPase [Pseudonocardiales bacterium]
MAVSSAFAGRRRELQAVAGVLGGDTDAVAMLLVGPAGVGKSRLVAEATHVVAQSDVTVLTGWCLGLSEGLPFLPVADVLCRLGELDGGQFLNVLLSNCPPFVRGQVVRLMPQLEELGEQWRPAELDGGWLRQRLFDALRRLLVELGSLRRAAVVIEDVQWADPSTLELLDYLLAPGHAPGVPLLLTCRRDEEPTPRLTDWSERVHRHARVRRVDLAAMTEEETGEQVEHLVGHRVSGQLVHEIFSRSEGNAFFTEQLAAVAEEDGEHRSNRRPLPAGLTTLLLARTAQVSASAREVMVALAVAARPLSEASLVRLCGQPETDVRAALRELLAQRLLRQPDHAGRLQLRHALLAEAISETMLASDRRELHRQVAELMARERQIGVAAEIAMHFAEADAPTNELPWRVQAAIEAETVYAWNEAAGQWRRVISLWDRVPTAASASLDLAQAYLSAAAAEDNAGDAEAAARLAEQAVARLATTAGPETAVRLYGALGRFRGIESLPASEDALAIAVEVGAALPPSRDYVWALRSLARVRSEQGRPEDERPLMVRAFRAAERAGFLAEQKSLLAELGWLATADGDIADAIADFDRAARIAPESEDPRVEALVAINHTDALLRLGELEQAVAVGAWTIDWAERHGVLNSPRFLVIRRNMVVAQIERGDLDGAAHLVDSITGETPTLNSVTIYLCRADLDTRRGRLAEAAAVLTNCADLVTSGADPELHYVIAETRIQLDLWQGQFDVPADALSILERYCRTDGAPFAGEMFVLMLRACAGVAERARATGDGDSLDSANQLVARLSDLRSAAPVDPLAARRVPVTTHADLLSWQAEATRLRGESGTAAWQRAVEAWDGLRRPHRAAYARWRQAEAILAQGQPRTAAAGPLRTAAAQAAGHVPLSKAISDLARRARIELTKRDHETPLAEPRPVRSFGLTERELAVLQLLGQGKTNPEIGSALFISPRTASVHVTNILRKLDVATRVQAATLAERAGLLGG